MRPAAVLLANEYNRTEWIAAARAEGIPVAAVQARDHPPVASGLHPSHPSSRAPVRRSDIRLRPVRAAATLRRGRYRPDEVVVGGSPRLDYVVPGVLRERDAVRRELGVKRGDRLVVVSTTWAELHRRFDLPVSLAALFDRPLPGVHLVFKLHPREPDEGAYRRLLEGLAARAWHPASAMTIVQRTDLYRLLAAADAHVGAYSTVNTEAVVTGTPNLCSDNREAGPAGLRRRGSGGPRRNGGELLYAPTGSPRAPFPRRRGRRSSPTTSSRAVPANGSATTSSPGSSRARAASGDRPFAACGRPCAAAHPARVRGVAEAFADAVRCASAGGAAAATSSPPIRREISSARSR